MNYSIRDIMLDIKESDYRGGIVSKEFNLETLEALLKLDFLDSDDQHNSSPTVGEIMEFMRTYPGFTAHGYVVTSKRDDVRISLEGVQYYGEVDFKILLDFANIFRHADKFSATEDYLHCWYD